MFSVGWLVAYLTVLLVVAEPLRNAGRYTMADVLAYRLKPRPVRAMASVSTLTVSTFYMIAQMVGAGALVALLLKDSGISYRTAVIGVGILMIVYVLFGGMLAPRGCRSSRPSSSWEEPSSSVSSCWGTSISRSALSSTPSAT